MSGDKNEPLFFELAYLQARCLARQVFDRLHHHELAEIIVSALLV